MKTFTLRLSGVIPTPRGVISVGFAGRDRKTLFVVGSGADDASGKPIREGPQQTAATIYKLPIKICILNNMYLGMVRQWQELFHDSKYSQVDLEASPDFVKLAEAYGAHAIRCSQPSMVKAALEEAMSITDRPTVLDFRIAKEENVFPMIAAGKSNDDIITDPALKQPELVEAGK